MLFVPLKYSVARVMLHPVRVRLPVAVIALTVGASLLAKRVNENAALLVYLGALGFFASKLAPTVGVRNAPWAASNQRSAVNI